MTPKNIGNFMIVRSELKGKHGRLKKEGQAKPREVPGFRRSGGTITWGSDGETEKRSTSDVELP